MPTSIDMPGVAAVDFLVLSGFVAVVSSIIYGLLLADQTRHCLCKSSQMPPESRRVTLHRLRRRRRDAIDRAAASSNLEA